MDETKTPFQSLTVVSAGTSALIGLLGAVGMAIDPQVAGQAVNGVGQLLSAITAGIAVYGRLRATRRIARRN